MRKLQLMTILALVCAAPTVRAGTVTIGGANDANISTDVKDNTIFQNNVNNSDGGGPGMFAGTNGTNSPRRGLIEFTIAGNIPTGATINSVQLELFVGQTAGGGTSNFNIGLYDVSKSWGEGTAGTGNTSIGGTGQGFAAGAGDATWNASAFPSTLWTKPGGDVAGTASATTLVGSTVNTPGQVGPFVATTWASNAALVADVQGWLNNPATNFGWELINANETDGQTFRAFWTKEVATAALRPELVVNFTPAPEPSSLLLLAAGCALCASPRLRGRLTRTKRAL